MTFPSNADIGDEDTLQPSEEGLRALEKFKSRQQQIILNALGIVYEEDFYNLEIGDIISTKEKPMQLLKVSSNPLHGDRIYVKILNRREGELTGKWLHKVAILHRGFVKLTFD